MFTRLLSTVAAVAITVSMGTAHAAEKIKVVVIDGYPAKAMWVSEFTNFFIPEVDKRLAANGNYEMDWQESYGGSIHRHCDHNLSFVETAKPGFSGCHTVYSGGCKSGS